jgi:hypothetical protein
MTTTPQAQITLMEAAQSQKHVTANEAFLRLDALLQLNVISGSVTTPPGSPAEGDKYIVPTGATGAWSGQTNKVALRMSGGWVFFTPRTGWLGWNAALGAFVSWDGTTWATLSLSGGGGGGVADNSVTNAKLADIATARIKGRTTAGTGDPEDLTGTQVTSLLDAFTSALKGLVPASGGGTVNFLRADGTWAAPPAATIADDAVTNAKLANVATGTIKGRVTAATGDPEDLSGTQVTSLLDAFTSALKGLVPASGGGTTNFLRADGSWVAPPAPAPNYGIPLAMGQNAYMN